jgi:hypothetical protein
MERTLGPPILLPHRKQLAATQNNPAHTVSQALSNIHQIQNSDYKETVHLCKG